MSTFTKIRDAIEEFFSTGFHHLAEFFSPLLHKVADDVKEALPEIGSAALAAALAAVSKGGGAEEAYKAAKSVSIDRLKALGLQEAASLALTARTLAVNAAAQATEAAKVPNGANGDVK